MFPVTISLGFQTPNNCHVKTVFSDFFPRFGAVFQLLHGGVACLLTVGVFLSFNVYDCCFHYDIDLIPSAKIQLFVRNAILFL